MICWNVVAIQSSWQPSSICPRNCIPLTAINYLAGHVVEQLHTKDPGCAWRSPFRRGGRTRFREDEAKDQSTIVSGWCNGTGVVTKYKILVSCTAQRLRLCLHVLLVKWARAQKGESY